MEEHLEMSQELRKSIDNAAGRLVYADWLEERGFTWAALANRCAGLSIQRRQKRGHRYQHAYLETLRCPAVLGGGWITIYLDADVGVMDIGLHPEYASQKNRTIFHILRSLADPARPWGLAGELGNTAEPPEQVSRVARAVLDGIIGRKTFARPARLAPYVPWLIPNASTAVARRNG